MSTTKIIFRPIKFPKDKTSYIAPTWGQMGELTFSLATKILAGRKKFDRLVTMAKGGWTWSRTMADYLNLKEVGSIHIKFYTGIFATKNTPVIAQSLPISVANERLLVFDDVADSGETLVTVKKYLEMCGAKSITTAALFYKSWAKFIPDFYAAKTDSWIIVPHEIRETIGLLATKWKKQQISPREITSRFSLLGLPEKQVQYFLGSISS